MKARLRQGRFFFHDGTSAPDPDNQLLHDAMYAARYNLAGLTQAQAYLLCEAAQAYQYYAAHPQRDEAIFEQLKQLRVASRRAIR